MLSADFPLANTSKDSVWAKYYFKNKVFIDYYSSL